MKRLNETTIEITVGAFMFMVLLALGFFTIVFSRENLLAPRYELQVLFPRIQGLRHGDNVFVRGMDIGRVKALRLAPEGVYVVLRLKQEIPIYEDYKIEILPSSVLGGQYVSIYQGTEQHPRVPEGAVLRGTPPVSLMDEATRAVQAVQRAVDESKMMENISQAAAQIRSLVERISRGEGTLGRLITDERLYDEWTRIGNDVAEITARLRRGEGSLGRILSEDDQLYRDLVEAVASLREVVASISRGEGTLGKLTRDDRLYEQAQLLINDIRAAVDDLRETTPLTTFTSVFFGAF